MIRAIVPVAAAAAGLLGLSTHALAATTVSNVSGTMSPTQETCLQGLVNAVGDGENCMYDGGPAADPTWEPTLAANETTGSYNSIDYYDSVTTPAAFQTTPNGSGRAMYLPTVGDGKISQLVNGTITVDDGGNGFGAGDLISFTLTLTSPGTGSIVRVYGGATVVDKYDSMTQVLAPTIANSATPNAFGGFDYIIGSEGFPRLLNFAGTLGGGAGDCVGVVFGNVECGHSFTDTDSIATLGVIDPDFWFNSSPAGIGLLENNLGAKTTGTLVNLQCIDGATAAGVESNDCRDSQVAYSPWLIGPNAAGGGATGNASTPGSERGAAEDVAWDQLLLKVSTNAAGQVLGFAGYNVDDYRVFAQVRCGDNNTGSGAYIAVCNSWTSGLFRGGADGDGDGIQNLIDNCRTVANPTQRDTDGDGYGNICDADLNQSGLTTSGDFGILRSNLNQPCLTPVNSAPCNADMNGSGLVTSGDFGLLRARLNTAPGPSGVNSN